MKERQPITYCEPRTIGEVPEVRGREGLTQTEVAAPTSVRSKRGLVLAGHTDQHNVVPGSSDSNTSTSDASRTVVANVCRGDFCLNAR